MITVGILFCHFISIEWMTCVEQWPTFGVKELRWCEERDWRYAQQPDWSWRFDGTI